MTKPAFDEQTLARLLEAAYVVQEHNRELQALETHQTVVIEETPSLETPPADAIEPAPASETSSKHDYSLTLAQIVETQHRIQQQHLGLDDVLALVAQRVTEITRADGAAIAILDKDNLRYKACAGLITPPVNSDIPLDRSLCRQCVGTGQAVHYEDLSLESLFAGPESFGREDWRRRGIRGLIAVPLYHEGGVAGALELYYAGKDAFTEHDVHSCQLMAGLVTEAFARHDEISWKKSLATERALMLETLEKIQPNLTALVESNAGKDAGERRILAETPSASNTQCRKCGHELLEAEQFCGNCGLPRRNDYEPATIQNKQASPSSVPAIFEKNTDNAPASDSFELQSPAPLAEELPEKALADSIEEEMPELFAPPQFRAETARAAESPDLPGASQKDLVLPVEVKEPGDEETVDETGSAAAALVPASEAASHWRSAAAARDFLEHLAQTKPPAALARFWRARRGDFYLAVAVILVACVIRWGIWSDHSIGRPSPGTVAAANHKPSPNDDLSFLDRVLIKLGIAEAPEPPEYKGNPETQVWVDLHSALYYCPGTDLYGKTPNGKFTTQRDAQLDQFEPAYRKACN